MSIEANNFSIEQVIELEENIKLKNLALEIYKKFIDNVKLSVGKYKNGRFEVWSDQYNATYLSVNERQEFEFYCAFLHEKYSVIVTPNGIFDALKRKYRGVDHLVSMVDMAARRTESTRERGK